MTVESTIYETDVAKVTTEYVRIGSFSFPISEVKGISSEEAHPLLKGWMAPIVSWFVVVAITHTWIFPFIPYVQDQLIARWAIDIVVFGLILIALYQVGITTNFHLALYTRDGKVEVLKAKNKLIVEQVRSAIEAALASQRKAA